MPIDKCKNCFLKMEKFNFYKILRINIYNTDPYPYLDFSLYWKLREIYDTLPSHGNYII